MEEICFNLNIKNSPEIMLVLSARVQEGPWVRIPVWADISNKVFCYHLSNYCIRLSFLTQPQLGEVNVGSGCEFQQMEI